jgi:hypothetical protein
VGTWGEHVGTSVGTSVPVGSDRVTTVAETRLTIRAVDASGQREVWVGSATGEVREGDDRHAVDEAVAAALDGFPTRRR